MIGFVATGAGEKDCAGAAGGGVGIGVGACTTTAGAGGGGGGGGAAGAAATGVAALAAAPDSWITASCVPTATVESTWTIIFCSTPATGDGISVSTLSVETSSNGSSTAI